MFQIMLNYNKLSILYALITVKNKARVAYYNKMVRNNRMRLRTVIMVDYAIVF